MRNLLDEKVIEKLHKTLERTRCQLIDELDQSLKQCQIKENILNKEIEKEVEDLKRESLDADIKSGDYDEERDGEYEFIMYDDDIEEEIYNPFSYLKGKRESKYKINLLGESFNFWIEDLKKMQTKIKTSKSIDKSIDNPSINLEENSFEIYKMNNLCDECKSECKVPHLQFSSILSLQEESHYNKCYYCVLNNKRQFVLNLLKPSSAEKLLMYATNYNVLRIMSGMGGLAYSN